MKLFNKFFLIIALLWTVSACKVGELEGLLNDPNKVSPENAGIDFLYNNAVLEFTNFLQTAWVQTGQMSRQYEPTTRFTYESAFPASSQNAIWNSAYAELIPDLNAIINLGSEKGLDVHVGAAKIMKAHTLTTLVDLFGDVPFTKAFQGTNEISPSSDPGADVYAAAEGMLNDAITLLTGTNAAAPENDYYDGDATKWITLAKTLKLRMYNNMRLLDAAAAKSKINALLADGDLIDEPSEDFQFQFGSQRNNPNSRHFFYNSQYEASDGPYMSNYYMWLLQGEKLDASGNPVTDPRIRFYFYRQVKDAYGQDVNVYSCIFSESNEEVQINLDRPEHYTAVSDRMPFCVLPDGYYGRDHMNGSGIPPDGPIRTVYGLYPGGGKFDDNTFTTVQNSGTDGGKGEGIHPILLSSFVDFIRAEAALTLGTTDDARAMLEKGIEQSIAKVFSFKSLVPSQMSRTITNNLTGETKSIEEIYVPSDDDVRAYIDFVLAQYDAAGSMDEKLDIIMKEFLIAAWGNGEETYNNYRRTCMPTGAQPAIEPAHGDYIRSFLYPADHVNLNSNVSQKSGVTDGVFWDTNPVGCAK